MDPRRQQDRTQGATMTEYADSVRARLSAEAQQHVDAKMAEWFGHEAELGAFALEDVRELGRNAI